MTLQDIQQLIKPVAQHWATANELAVTADEEIQRLLLGAARPIRTAMKHYNDGRSAVVEAIDGNPELFDKPKSQAWLGFKYGLKKGRGSTGLNVDEAVVVARIEKKFGVKADLYLHTKKTVNKEAVAELEAKELAALGISIEAVGDTPFIVPVTGEAAKIVARLSKLLPEES